MGVTSSLRFNYGGIWSDDMGIINVNTQDSGLYQDVLVGDREIKEVIVRHRKKPYFQRIQDDPITLTLRFSFIDPFDKDSIRKVVQWLCAGEQYQELYFSDNPDRRFFAMYVGTNSQLQHNGLGEGFMTLTMRCDAPYSYSPQYGDGVVYDFSTTGSGTIQFPNYGDLSLYPEMWITKFGDNNGDVSIVNASNGGQLFKFNSAKLGTGTLNIMSNVVDGMLVQIGRDVYEFDTDGVVNTGNIQVSIPSTDLSASTAMSALAYIVNSSTSRVENVTASVTTPTIAYIHANSTTTGTNTYSYQVVALDANNNVLATSTPASISNVATLGSANTITIKWCSVANVAQYAIYRSTNSGSYVPIACLPFPINGCNLTDSGGSAITLPTGIPSVPPTASSNNTDVLIVSNVLGYTMPVDSNYPSICMWSVTQIDGGGLQDQEQVYIDNDNQIIKSLISDDTYRYDAFNDGYLELPVGMNNLIVTGYCQIQFRYRFLTLQG